jgi:subtilase family serine protease
VTISSGAPDLPDLAAITVPNPPVNMKLGGSFPVTDTVQSTGTATAGASVSRYYLSLDPVKSSGDMRLTGSRSVPSLAPTAQSSGTATLTIPTMTVLGSYYLLACADDTQVVVESREDNNCKASATTVRIEAPDLVETAGTNPPATAKRGGRFSVTDTARNTGTTTAKASVTRYYLSPDPARSSGDTRLKGSRSVSSLAQAAQSSGTVRVTIPTATTLGSYYLLVCADDTKAVVESQEGNNCKASATGVTVKP